MFLRHSQHWPCEQYVHLLSWWVSALFWEMPPDMRLCAALLCLLQVTQLERNMNVLVFVQFTALVVFCAVLAGLDQWWAARHSAPSWWYLQSQNVYPELPPGVAAFFISVSTEHIYLCKWQCTPQAAAGMRF